MPAGVLLYLPGAKTTVESSRLSDNNIGVEYISGRETRPAEPELNLTANTIEGGYASVQINQGNAALSRDKLSGGLIAIDVNENEYGGGFGTPTAYAPDATSARRPPRGLHRPPCRWNRRWGRCRANSRSAATASSARSKTTATANFLVTG